MKDIKRLLEIRRRKKARMPSFLAQDTHKRKEIRKRWKRPRGLHSKMRLSRKGYRRSVSAGYGSPRMVRGLHSSGAKVVRVRSEKDLKGVGKGHAVLISSTIGKRKRITIIEHLFAKGILILNIKDPKGYLESVKKELQKRKEDKKVLKQKKQKAEKTKKKDEKLSEKVMSEEERKLEDKKEKDKILTKRDAI